MALYAISIHVYTKIRILEVRILLFFYWFFFGSKHLDGKWPRTIRFVCLKYHKINEKMMIDRYFVKIYLPIIIINIKIKRLVDL